MIKIDFLKTKFIGFLHIKTWLDLLTVLHD